ncbi:phosphoethanolamine--lipid A transferase [Cocleimonas sp. KMM 6892]|uniref:phosphoethanolamine transferase n=1 Tax=unclassified Cocleimonas TaxID=2639732 RepID=UPI002DBAD658|nr:MULTISPECIES: phosphoethanolamine--lipid A transferase [unclassified Cocleimonas]MEB8433543.1 phosphoethanolamine--lipid A transferase [Cocleimonas sp. KMM 6892]MEC4716354.1 phosphoethanolamine--lipid A transferase [Cocleimonas sp. KMM 6895]MEC4745753.1 phosphoethanolamine--lipid A transferase [Cocleimonas sp. KMM 6896]
MTLKLSLWKVTLLISLYLTLFTNYSFWSKILSLQPLSESPVIGISFFLILVTVFNILLTLFSFKPIFKPIVIIILLCSASAAYFMDNYAIMIDKSMIRNIFATDVHEATDLFSYKLVMTLLLLGVVPAWLLYKTEINYQPFFKGLAAKGLVILISSAVLGGTLYSNYKELSFFGRNNREARHLINPINYIGSIKSIVAKDLRKRNYELKPIEDDAQLVLSDVHAVNGIPRKPSLVILVLGETARAMNFSLNGYERNTNPLLAKQDIINFSDVSSCGTATAVSVPCMFSKFTRDEFNFDKGREYENLFDVISHAGYKVLWRDNNTGCQHSCDRIAYEHMLDKLNPKFCETGNCVDEVLIEDLQQIVDASNTNTAPNEQLTKVNAVIESPQGDRVIILHKKGNHGPTYSKRYPAEFEKFTPVCKTNQLVSCTQEEIVNAYDNAILYTDYFLDKSINFLKKNSEQFDTAMVYISDHGESLGENNLYLHGLPYMIAPDYQKKVPFMLWLSKGYEKTHSINKDCVASKSATALSHDNLFSSILGMLSIETKVHDKQLDIFSSCKSTQIVKK